MLAELAGIDEAGFAGSRHSHLRQTDSASHSASAYSRIGSLLLPSYASP